MKDLRDPLCVGETLLRTLSLWRNDAPDVSASVIADRYEETLAAAPVWTGDGLMSNDPTEHHSKTSQADAAVGAE